ncbi:MAG: hypothetical protein EPO52_04415 [Herbiconiux sp.]|uniref:anti-sigma factor family protein n=1 Tax=Herbiconiux sp. TaxID=1871186 RepID=UPI0011F98A66|nr:zf-HC2 domain-containing protein [Herbiconiux sp.]TAJ49519.1 MAG: hypothetical protein EPO52_04415 [Herbiconiux sp.]
MTDPHEFTDWDAAYVLGMLSPDERRRFERHLTGCPACSQAVAELAGMPGILAGLSTSDATALLADDARAVADAHLRELEHEPSQVSRLAASVTRNRRRVRRRLAALVTGVGVVVAVLGLAVGVGISGGSVNQGSEADGPAATAPATSGTPAPVSPGAAGTDTVARSMSQVEPGFLAADLTVTPKGWGTRFDWNCSYRDEWGASSTPVTYDLVVTDATGTETTVATWSAAGGAAGNLSASTSIPTDQIAAVDIRVAGSDRPLVRTTL